MTIARYRTTNYFSPNDSNSVDDISGFKKKRSELSKRWDGVIAMPDLIESRHPQDFPVTAVKQKVYKDIRVETAQPSETPAPTFDII